MPHPHTINEPVVFFGTGPVAARALELLSGSFQIEAVVTKPRPDHHKGSAPVIELADKLGLPIFYVKNKADLDTLMNDSPFKSKLGVLIDFGIIVSQRVIDSFPLGIVNSHFSLLPEWRGADPITFAVLSGQKKTGVSLMLLVEAMDEGPLLTQSSIEMTDNITTPELTDLLIELSDRMLKEVIPLYVTGTIRPVLQGQSLDGTALTPSYSRKLTKNDGIIDWAKPATEIEREVRAFIGWPGSRTTVLGKKIIITKARVVRTRLSVGVAQYNKHSLVVGCGRDSLEILALKPEGKNEMSSKAFLAGIR